MDENNKFLPVIIAGVIGVVLVLVLVLVFRNGDNGSDTVSGDAVQVVDEQLASEESESDEQSVTVSAESESDEQSVTVSTESEPNTSIVETGIVPDNWNELSPQEKTVLNPLGCDSATEIIWAEDGSCHPQSEDSIEDVIENEDVEISDDPIVVDPREELEQYLEDSEWTNVQKMEAMRSYCVDNPEGCLVWNLYHSGPVPDFPGNHRNMLCREAEHTVGIFCGDEAAYEHWQRLEESTAYESLYKTVEAYLRGTNPYETYVGIGDRHYYVTQSTLHALSEQIHLEYRVLVTFAQSDVAIYFVK